MPTWSEARINTYIQNRQLNTTRSHLYNTKCFINTPLSKMSRTRQFDREATYIYIYIYMPIIVQQDATIYSLFIPVNRSTCFGWYLHPSSGAHVTVSTASGISKIVTANCCERDWTGTISRPVTFTTGCSYYFTNARYCGYSDMIS